MGTSTSVTVSYIPDHNDDRTQNTHTISILMKADAETLRNKEDKKAHPTWNRCAIGGSMNKAQQFSPESGRVYMRLFNLGNAHTKMQKCSHEQVVATLRGGGGFETSTWHDHVHGFKQS